MKCLIGVLFLALGAAQLISAWPARANGGTGGMIFYQPSSSDYYNAHRAFVMQYASQPYRRRQGQAAVVNAYASGKKIRTGTFVGQHDYENQEAHLPAEEQQLVHSEAEAGRPGEYEPPHHDEEEEEEQHHLQQQPVATHSEVPAIAHDEIPETPVKKAPPQADEEDDDEDGEEENIPVRKASRGSSGITYFPVSFGSTNGGAIAIANSYSTGKGGTASSRATAYGSPAKAKATSKKRQE